MQATTTNHYKNMTDLEKLEAAEKEHEKAIEGLKKGAEADLAKEIKDIRAKLLKKVTLYAKITGKKLAELQKKPKPAKPAGDAQPRMRMSDEQKKALPALVLGAIEKHGKAGMKVLATEIQGYAKSSIKAGVQAQLKAGTIVQDGTKGAAVYLIAPKKK
jgi:hypothetical protein